MKGEKVVLSKRAIIFVSRHLYFLQNFFSVEMQIKVCTENGKFMFNYTNWKNYLFNHTLAQKC